MTQPNLLKQVDELARSLKGNISSEGLLEALSLLGLLASRAPEAFLELYRSGGNRQVELLKAALHTLAKAHPHWPCDVGEVDHLSPNEWQPLIYFVETHQAALTALPQALRDYDRDRGGKLDITSPTESAKQLITALAGDLSNRSLYDGSAGLADIPASLKPKALWLEESNATLWAISYRLLLIEGLNPEFAQGNSLAQSKLQKQADLVIMQPPFGNRLSPKDTDLLLKQGTILVEPGTRLPTSASDVLWIQQALAHCADNGRAIMQLPQGWLFRGGYDAKVREYLLNEDIIDAVIGLPPGMISSSGIPTTIVILAKQRQPGSPIHFVDAAKLGQNQRGQRKLDTEETDLITRLAQGQEPENPLYRAIYLPDIRKKGKKGIGGNSLNISDYFSNIETVEMPDSKHELDLLRTTQQRFETARQKLLALLND